MTSKEFFRWRELLGFTQAAAGRALSIDPRTISVIEKEEGDIPERIAIACAALTPRFLTKDGLRDLLKGQYADLDGLFEVISCRFTVHGPSAELLQTHPAKAVADWMAENTPSAKFSMRTILLPDQCCITVPVVVFNNESERLHFYLRWMNVADSR